MWAIYKTKSAMQFRIIPATKEVKDGYTSVTRYGSILIDASNGANKVYDWTKKINFAISEGDLALLYKGFKELDRTGSIDFALVHDPGANTDHAKQIVKNLSIKSATNPGTYYMNLSVTNLGVTTKVNLGIHEGELAKLRLFIEQNQGKILGDE